LWRTLYFFSFHRRFCVSLFFFSSFYCNVALCLGFQKQRKKKRARAWARLELVHLRNRKRVRVELEPHKSLTSRASNRNPKKSRALEPSSNTLKKNRAGPKKLELGSTRFICNPTHDNIHPKKEGKKKSDCCTITLYNLCTTQDTYVRLIWVESHNNTVQHKTQDSYE
jgi:hypothetical protein